MQRVVGAYVPPPLQANVFYLTIDDGPAGEATYMLLDILEKYHFQATFFWLWSRFVEKHKDYLRERLLQGGHQMGLHGYVHLSLWRGGNSVSTLIWAERLWQEAGIGPAAYYRPPYGHLPVGPWKKGLPYKLILWDLMPPDYRKGTSWAEGLLARLRPGDVVVLHERRENVAEWKRFFSGVAVRGWRAIALPPVVGAPHSAEAPPQVWGPSTEGGGTEVPR
ncbi:MAG: hypothetical protein KatS3mg025_0973 [Bacteroidia bacterium]|nr:MAG: hypothetical protein KatS3mg025_0973 [Bacteroidia bacterium]